MGALLGITFPELLGTPPGVFSVLPPKILKFIQQLSLVRIETGISDSRTIHAGFAQLPDPVVDLEVFELRIPGLKDGLPFRFFIERAPQAAAEQMENQVGNWVLQIDCPEIFIPLPFEPGRFFPETAVSPAFLKEIPSGFLFSLPLSFAGDLDLANISEDLKSAFRAHSHILTDAASVTVDEDNKKWTIINGIERYSIRKEPDKETLEVFSEAPPKPEPKLILDAGVLEITSGGDFRVRPDFSFHPGDTPGDLVRFRVDPPGFFIGGLGAFLPEGVIDLSDETSPSTALVAGFGDDFKGVYLKEFDLFFPRETPLVGSFLRSAGVREALIGNAYAGEAFIEFGPEVFNTPPVPTFLQVIGNKTQSLNFNPDTNELELIMVPEAFARVIAIADVNTPWREHRSRAHWIAPDGLTYTGARTPPIQVTPGDTIIHYFSADEGFEPPPTRTIKITGVVSPGAAARLQVHHNGNTFEDVTFLAATSEWLSTATLHVTGLEDNLEFNWLVNLEFGVRGQRDVTGKPLPFSIPKLSQKPGQRVGISAHGHKRFIILDVIEGGDPIIVSQGKPMDEAGTVFQFNRFGPVYHLAMALAKGELRQMEEQPPAIPAEGELPQLQPGRLYEATFERVEPREIPPLTVISILYHFEKSSDPYALATRENVTPENPIPEYRKDELEPITKLGEKLRNLKSGEILIVGRTSRLGDGITGNEDEKFAKVNDRLQKERADDAELLVKRNLPSGLANSISIKKRGEMKTSESDVAFWDSNIGNKKRAAKEDTAPGQDHSSETALHDLVQRADIYIRRATFTPIFKNTLVGRRVLLPGPPDAPNPPIYNLPADGRLRRLRLSAKWDREPIPVKAEILTVWELKKIAIPIDKDLNTDPSSTTSPCASLPGGENPEEADFLRFLLRFVFDQRTGQARWTGAVDSAGDQDGLKKFCDTGVIGLLLLAGPMLAGEPPTNSTDGAEMRFLALSVLLPSAFLLTGGDNPIISNVDIILNGITFEADTQEGLFSELEAIRFKLDYSIAFAVQEPLFGLKTQKNPNTGDLRKVRTRFREVGLEIRNLGDVSSPFDLGYDNFNLLFDPSKGSIEIEDPGAFDIDGPLGKLLNITAARIGHGSLFFEFDMEFVLDLGIVEISQATLRIAFEDDGPSVELRGLEAGINIPDVIEGSGALSVLDGGQLKAVLDLDIIPAGVHAVGRLDLLPQEDFTAVAIAIDIEFATGLPIGSTGLGIYGFFGLFAANMARNVNRLAPDRAAVELTWFRQLLRGEGSPWLPQQQAWAFGVGAVIGPLPDSARSFHAKGALVLELPGPGVIFGIDAALLKKRRKTKNKDDLTGTMTGMALVDPFAYLIGIDVNLQVGKFLVVHIPISAFFPRKILEGESEMRPAFVRIGSDGVDPGGGRPPRVGTPARATLVAGSFGNVAEVYAYLMIEEKDLLDLGGVAELDFYGFSIGLGIGIEVRWGSGRVGLHASALLLVGLGTSPLVIAGKIVIKGELKLLVYSLSASANLDFRHDDDGTVFDGRFCGEIDFFFFSIEGCVHLRKGAGDPFFVPVPSPLITGISLVDRRGVEIAGADINETAPNLVTLTDPVWPDAVPVLHFTHEPETALDSAGQFHTSLHNLDYSQQVHAGSFTYTFRLKDLRLEKRVGQDFTAVEGQLPSAWWFPSWRPAFLDGEANPPSGEEARELGLLTWHPALWARSLIADQQQDTLDDIGESIENVCEDKQPGSPDCVIMEQALSGPGSGEWQALSEGGVFRAILTDHQINNEPLPQAIGTILSIGFHFEPAEVVDWQISHTLEGKTLSGGLRLAQASRFPTEIDALFASFCFTSLLRFTRSQWQPELVLAVRSDLVDDSQIEEIEVFTDANGFPLVRAVLPGSEIELIGEHVDSFETPFGSYRLIRYHYDIDDQAVSGWRILAYQAEIQVLWTCGHDFQNFQSTQDSNEDRHNWIDGLLAFFETTTLTTSQFILDAGAEYRVTAVWSWSGEHAEGGGPTPEQDVTQEFHFHTAPASVAIPMLTILEQAAFDPRALSNYVLAQPSLDEPPVFLDDAVSVHFSVDHITSLLDRYRRDFKMEVRRTDVPALPVQEGGGTFNIDFNVVFQQKLVEAVDIILSEAIAEAPCLDTIEPPLGGVEGVITFDMAPNAGYELRVFAPNRLNPSEPFEKSLFVRAPFRSSRYRNPLELFAALGFGTESEPGTISAAEAILALDFAFAALPPLLGEDAEFTETLSQLGLDTLELPSRPRTTILWKPLPDGTWQVIGLLLEAPEPIERSVRLHIEVANVRGQPFDPVRSTQAGDRILFMPSAPVDLPIHSESQVDIFYTENGGASLIVRRIMLASPVSALLEA